MSRHVVVAIAVVWALARPAPSRSVVKSCAADGDECRLFLPAHGLPIAGRDRIARVLVDVARALEQLVERTLERMNEGATLDAILHEVKVDAALLDKPYSPLARSRPQEGLGRDGTEHTR